MNFRKINVKCKQKDLAEIIKNLITKEDPKNQQDQIINYPILILDSAENYKTLGNMKDKVIDWDFVKEPSVPQQPKKEEEDASFTHPIFELANCNITDTVDLCSIEVYVSWKIYHDNPGVIPYSSYWLKLFKSKYELVEKTYWQVEGENVRFYKSLPIPTNFYRLFDTICYDLSYFDQDFKELISSVYKTKGLDLENFSKKIYELLKG